MRYFFKSTEQLINPVQIILEGTVIEKKTAKHYCVTTHKMEGMQLWENSES